MCDIRGWGYLTGNGHGALGLSLEEAVAIQTANARLIAAAPDMLEALQEILEFAIATRLDPQANVPAIQAIAEKAIAKATK